MNTAPDQRDTADGELRARLRAADPARTLSPADDQWLARVRNSAAQTSRTRTRRVGAPPGRSPRRRLLVPAAGLLGGAGAIAAALAIGLPAVQPATVLTLPNDAGGPAAICAPIDPVGLRQADTAFRADVVSLAGGRATLRVTDSTRGRSRLRWRSRTRLISRSKSPSGRSPSGRPC